jgi:hypothetical protein
MRLIKWQQEVGQWIIACIRWPAYSSKRAITAEKLTCEAAYGIVCCPQATDTQFKIASAVFKN